MILTGCSLEPGLIEQNTQRQCVCLTIALTLIKHIIYKPVVNRWAPANYRKVIKTFPLIRPCYLDKRWSVLSLIVFCSFSSCQPHSAAQHQVYIPRLTRQLTPLLCISCGERTTSATATLLHIMSLQRNLSKQNGTEHKVSSVQLKVNLADGLA